MSSSDHARAPVDLRTALWRGWRGLCPRCGGAPLFGGFLKMLSRCPACGLGNEPYRADDAPAYFTIFAVGHIVVPLVLVVERYAHEPPLWFHALLWLPLSVLLALILLMLFAFNRNRRQNEAVVVGPPGQNTNRQGGGQQNPNQQNPNQPNPNQRGS